MFSLLNSIKIFIGKRHSLLKSYLFIRNFSGRNRTIGMKFDNIYKAGLWGKEQAFDSGLGSESIYMLPYINYISTELVKESDQKIIDIGCGDFRVGSILCKTLGLEYLGIDVSTEIIDRNNALFSTDRVVFSCIDTLNQAIPHFDNTLYLVRQVLQHLSNKDIWIFLKNAKASGIKELVVTEHIALKVKTPNVDIETGAETRVIFESGVLLNEPPFSLKADILYEYEAPEYFFLGNKIDTIFRIYKVFL